METKLRIKNIVFVGNFNSLAFDKYFFIKNNIVSENDILPASRFDGLVNQLFTDKYDVIVNPGQITISSKILDNDEEHINNIATLIIKNENINVTAFGINFHWFLEDFGQSAEDFSKKHFYNENLEILSSFFNNDNARYGLYASTDFKDSRLKLDIKPGVIKELNLNESTVPINKDVIFFVFNFHFDIADKNRDNNFILNSLNEYSEYEQQSQKIISIYKY